MRETQSYSLYKNLIKHIAKMRKDIESTSNSNRWKRKQYPAVTVGAKYDTSEHIENHHDYSGYNDFEQPLLVALLNNYGKLNHKDLQSGNHVGHCAENYAATKILKDLHKNGLSIPLSNIEFTDAIRPRTWKMIDWCSICRNIFS